MITIIMNTKHPKTIVIIFHHAESRKGALVAALPARLALVVHRWPLSSKFCQVEKHWDYFCASKHKRHVFNMILRWELRDFMPGVTRLRDDAKIFGSPRVDIGVYIVIWYINFMQISNIHVIYMILQYIVIGVHDMLV